jgi:phosphotriesterase-related protein
MTVSGPIPPERVGFTLPHEHTGIHLWHVPDRWDYWELTPDEETVGDELRDFRRRGGSTLVDMTLSGVGRDPERLRRLATRTGVQIVMGTGWYRQSYYPADALIDRRSVDDLAAEMVAEFADGVAGTGVHPGIIGEIGTDKPRRGPSLEGHRHGHQHPRGDVAGRARPAAHLRRGGGGPGAGGDRPCRLVPGARPLPGRARPTR